jgi:hypothetical protein
METLAVSMIVRDEPVDRLVLLIDFLRPLWTQFVIADTGSEDYEIDAPLLRAAGADVFQIEWKDDFAWARNQTLDRISQDWVLQIDADEMPSLAMIDFIKSTLANPRPEVKAYRFFTRNFWGGEWGIEVDAHWHVRMFRKSHGRWYKSLHEQVEIDGKPESAYINGSPIGLEAPKDAYLIHSKPREMIDRSTLLYNRIGGI